MKRLHCFCVLAGCLAATINVCRADQPALESGLEPLRPLLEKTWKGAFKNSTPEKPVVDVMRWERALNGKAVRLLHSVNDGAYGGETVITWNAKEQQATFHYFTTAGFMTVGSMTFQDGKFITHEKVAGGAGGVTEVRGTTELLADGTLRVTTEHLKDGQWQPGRDVIYHEDSSAKVVFK
jgi:hypothetical protein